MGMVPGVAMRSSLIMPPIIYELESNVSDQSATCALSTSAAGSRRKLEGYVSVQHVSPSREMQSLAGRL